MGIGAGVTWLTHATRGRPGHPGQGGACRLPAAPKSCTFS